MDINKFDKEYFDKCFYIQCAWSQIFDYFWNKGKITNETALEYSLTNFAIYFWDKYQNLHKWNTSYNPNGKDACCWVYEENGRYYTDEDMLKLFNIACKDKS